ncbi:MAG: PRC-barrel domain-containing protein [Jaaginema sp. PMC 1079.18]|nr:PRC-barrel domain-containing protein [Jaaginema sp. PMC 1080.18]MEC4849616.1 PRC-barrel domain-containing protein [Jaaginema sp. PMC 1079.18]MEC4866210.1 PRC-barrel domain-containing protein [Jaaginema sp. PMC 1078.18]
MGFLVNTADNPDESDILPFEQVENISPQGIVVGSEPVVLAMTQTEHIQQALAEQIVLEGRPVVTPEGDYLGRLQDLYLNPRTGKIEGYDVKTQDQDENIFVQAVRVDDGEANSIALIQQTSAKSRLVGVSAGKSEAIFKSLENAKSLTCQPSSTSELLNPASWQIKPFVNRSLERTKGRRIRQRLCDRQGNTIALPGQIVTKRLLAKAKSQNLGKQLCAAVGLEGFTATEGASETSESFSSESQDDRVKKALGHPVTRHIQDGQGNTILNVGDLITYQAVERCRQGDVLYLMLDSVYVSPKRSSRSRRRRSQS